MAVCGCGKVCGRIWNPPLRCPCLSPPPAAAGAPSQREPFLLSIGLPFPPHAQIGQNIRPGIQCQGGYAADTPIAIVQKASWPEQKIVRGTLATIAEQAAEAKIDRTAMIVVSRCLGADYELSRLYAPEFSHMFRKASR